MQRKCFVMMVAVSLLAFSSTDVQAQGTLTSIRGFTPEGISGNIVLGQGNNGQAVLYNDITQTTVVLNVPTNSSATGMSGNYIVGTYKDNSGDGNGFLYDITTGTYITLNDPSASTSGDAGTYFNGIYGNNIVGNYYNSSRADFGFEYNISNQTWSTLFYPGLGNVGVNGIYGSDIVGNISNPSSGLPEGFLYNGSTWSTIMVPGSSDTLANGIFGTEIVGTSGGGTTPNGYVYNIATGTFTYPLTLSNFSVLNGATSFEFTGISGSSLMGEYTYPRIGGGSNTAYFLYTVPEISSMWLMAVPFVGVLFFRLKRV